MNLMNGDDLGREKAEVVCFWVAFEGVDGWSCVYLGGIKFQMTGAAVRKEREPKLVLDGVGLMLMQWHCHLSSAQCLSN